LLEVAVEVAVMAAAVEQVDTVHRLELLVVGLLLNPH
jgi:hypothetical protein